MLKKGLCQQVAHAVTHSVLKLKTFCKLIMKLPCACPGDDSFHFCMWFKISLKLRSWTWCWQSELIGLFSCQACVKNKTWKRAVGVIVWFRYYRAYPAWNVHISSLISFGPTNLLFVRRSWQQSVPRDATAAAGVAVDGSTYVGLKPMHCLLKCSAWWWCKEGLRLSCGNDIFVVHLMN